jgi:hypothetical protein
MGKKSLPNEFCVSTEIKVAVVMNQHRITNKHLQTTAVPLFFPTEEVHSSDTLSVSLES